jgi:hypothetical protein
MTVVSWSRWAGRVPPVAARRLRNHNSAGSPEVSPFLYGSAKYPHLPIVGYWTAGANHRQTIGVARPVKV